MAEETWNGARIYDGRPSRAGLAARLRRDGVDPTSLAEVVLTCEAQATGRVYYMRALGYRDAQGRWFSYCLRSDGRIRRREHAGDLAVAEPAVTTSPAAGGA
ncbi:hypothetical protein [Arenibaculum pallidiluteum]|uniref:hypothetical protein n=1 Tax=Arenibaculum pallidiluteum TaxID=2812559 RepID=UPI001A95BF45|nr:hypothetical protein [Arenibaculum pallidiluteum]